MKKVAILQSNYIPWKGYFDIINMVDEFIIYDEVQYTKNDWRNRNIVKAANGPIWLTIPIITKGKSLQKISEAKTKNTNWPEKHWKTIFFNYKKTDFFNEYKNMFEKVYENIYHENSLSKINYLFINKICHILGITSKISWSTEYRSEKTNKTERLVQICKAAGATHYLSGPSARAYIQKDLFDQAGITLEYMDYSGYPEYPQLYPPFEHAVSILDLLFNVGPQAPKYMKSFR